MADDPDIQSEPKDQPRPDPEKDPAELSPEELEQVSGGAASCASGKHFDKATITP